jgi:hypothetical protein
MSRRPIPTAGTISGTGNLTSIFTPTITQTGNTFTNVWSGYYKLPGLLMVQTRFISVSAITQPLTITIPGGFTSLYVGNNMPAGILTNSLGAFIIGLDVISTTGFGTSNNAALGAAVAYQTTCFIPTTV